MKKLLVLATLAIAAAFTACSDVTTAVAPTYEGAAAQQSEARVMAGQLNEEHLSTSCQAAVDHDATIHFDLTVNGAEGVLTRTYHHDFERGADAACAAVRDAAMGNDKIICTDTSVEVVSEYEGMNADDFYAMVHVECLAEK